jgi:hypothetical protein
MSLTSFSFFEAFILLAHYTWINFSYKYTSPELETIQKNSTIYYDALLGAYALKPVLDSHLILTTSSFIALVCVYSIHSVAMLIKKKLRFGEIFFLAPNPVFYMYRVWMVFSPFYCALYWVMIMSISFYQASKGKESSASNAFHANIMRLAIANTFGSIALLYYMLIYLIRVYNGEVKLYLALKEKSNLLVNSVDRSKPPPYSTDISTV